MLKHKTNRLCGVMVKASASRAEGRGSITGRVIPKTLRMDFFLAVPPTTGTL